MTYRLWSLYCSNFMVMSCYLSVIQVETGRSLCPREKAPFWEANLLLAVGMAWRPSHVTALMSFLLYLLLWGKFPNSES